MVYMAPRRHVSLFSGMTNHLHHASIAVKAGVPIGVVSERLGHASPEFTLHRYSHVMPGMQREAADTIARAVRFDAA